MPKAFRPKWIASAAAKDDRLSASKRGYGKRWQKERINHLVNEPLCRHCLAKGLIVLGNEVDHIIPHKGKDSLMWDTSNWQTLCKPCHSRKTATEGRQHPPRGG